MKKILIAFVLALFAATAFAKGFEFHACTTDHKDVVLSADLDDNVPSRVVAEIAAAFKDTGAALSSDELRDSIGYRLFASKLSDEDKEAFNSLVPPQIVGDCK